MDNRYNKLVHADPNSLLHSDLTDDEYLEWVGDWLDKADDYLSRSGNSPIFFGRENIRRLHDLAKKNDSINDER